MTRIGKDFLIQACTLNKQQLTNKAQCLHKTSIQIKRIHISMSAVKI